VEITEVRIKLILNRNDKLRAFCSVTFDNAFVIRDLKIIEGAKGPFVAMPSRKLTDRCPRCSMKNHLRAKFCNDCGTRLAPERAPSDNDGRSKLHADIAHPISAPARESVQKRILAAFVEELEKSKLPGYKPVEIYETSEELEPE
jgi:stage V sporulation protein G